MIQENTNKAILINSIILYFKLGISTIAGLLTTRFALGALGANDFGLFSVVGGVISFIALFNTIMLSTTNRFIATAIGKNDINLINKTFNVNLAIHFFIAVLTIIVAYPLGDWYINNYINFNGDISLVKSVYHIIIIGSIISFIGVPYNGLLIAKERFVVFSSIDILSHILKCIGAYLLYFIMFNKLFFYAAIQSLLTSIPTIIFWAYCKKEYPLICKFKVVKDFRMYKEVLCFSIWIGYGAIAYIGKSQGAALIVNKFFNTVMNAALGIANSANSMIMTVGNTIGRSISPQIVKSYSSGDIQRSLHLVVMCSKFTFLATLLTSSPFLIEPDFLFKLWLGNVPDYSTTFIRLLIIDALIIALNAGITDLIHATGRIKNFQLFVNTISLISIIVGYIVLKFDKPAYFLNLTYILFSIIILFVRQIFFNKVVNFDNKIIFKNSYLPCFLVVVAISPFYIFHNYMHPLLSIVCFAAIILFFSFYIGLNKDERTKLVELISKSRKS